MSECKQAQSHEQQIAELKDSRLPKTEREHAAVREIERLEQRLAEADAKLRWIPVSERLPEVGQTVIAAYKNKYGYWRQIRAEYLHPHSVEADAYYDHYADYEPDYDEETDNAWAPAGWIESIDNWDEYESVDVVDVEVTHWMPLPKPPEGE